MASKTEELSRMELGDGPSKPDSHVHDSIEGFWHSPEVVTMAQKVVAEFMGTYFIIFIGCGSVVVQKNYDGVVTFPGICVTWGLIVMVMIYNLGHVSGAHFNPAVTVTFAIFGRFPWKEVPLYIIAQLMGSLLASGTLDVMFDVTKESFFGTIPAGTHAQSFGMEIIISFILMFNISGICTDSRSSTGTLEGFLIGMTITMNVFVAGPISGASMNPARSIGPAIMNHEFNGLWVYILGPPIGTLLGALCYNLLRFTDKPLAELSKPGSSQKTTT